MMGFQTSFEPTSKVYTTLKIIDEYQPVSTADSPEPLDTEEMLSPKEQTVDVYDSFSIKIMDHGLNTTKFDLSYKNYVWIVSKNQEMVDQYLESINVSLLSDLNIQNRSPRFSTLLFFDFFKKQDNFAQIDVFRNLALKVDKIDVKTADLKID